MLDNIEAVAREAGGSLDDIVKLTLLLADLGDFAKVNAIMAARFKQPFPARATYPGGGAAQRRVDRNRGRVGIVPTRLSSTRPVVWRRPTVRFATRG